ncbi:MAG: Arc family DNA-binding protein [Caenispirillum sp.]|nr:Arc family DNA-binding protein [Caenispirillum sp.]
MRLYDAPMILCASLRVKRKVRYLCGMARDDLHFRLRIPEALKARIEKSAAENNRSMTAEIVSRLERSFNIEPEWTEAIQDVSELWRRVDEIERMVRDHDERLNPMDYNRD